MPSAARRLSHRIIGDKARVGVRGSVAEFSQGKGVELAQQVQGGSYPAESQGHPNRHITVAQAPDQNHQHGDAQQDPENLVHDLSGIVARAELFVVTSPLLRNLDELPVTRHLVAIYLHFDAQTSITEVHALLLPRKVMVGARRALLRLRLNELEVGKIPPHHLIEKCLRDGPGRSLIQGRARRRFGDIVVKAHHFARGRQVHAEFFLLLWLEPAMGPMPKMNRPARQPVHPFQALSTLQINLRLIVVIERRRMAITVQLEATLGKELLRQGSRVVPVHAELNRRLRKCMREVLDADGERKSSNEDGNNNGLAIG